MIKTHKNIIFLGSPGTGKGTISAELNRLIGIKHISTGDIFREEIKNKTNLGLKIQKNVASGLYVSDQITNEVIAKKVNELKSNNINYILDGFPRTVEQANFLETLNQDQFMVLLLELSEEEIVKRLSQRLFCPLCKKIYNNSSIKSAKHPYCEIDGTLLVTRADDKPEAIIKRLEVYEEQTKILIDYYDKKSILFKIDGNDQISVITAKILELYNK